MSDGKRISSSSSFRVRNVERMEREPDYRFTLANERTFLAYVRTALGLDAAGLAATQFLHPSSEHLRLALGLVLVGLGGAVAVLGYRRWEATERAMRHGEPLPPLRLPLAISLGMLVISITALALVISTR
jgi:inner membrane protein YidH